MNDDERYWKNVEKARREYEASKKTFAEHYRAGRSAEKFWESKEGASSVHADKYRDRFGRYKYRPSMLHNKKTAIEMAERELPESVMRTRYWSPDDVIEDRFRRQKGKRRKKRGKKKACKGRIDRAIESTGVKKMRL
jgi:hypothetical protein